MNQETVFKGIKWNGIFMLTMNILLLGASICCFILHDVGNWVITAGIVLLLFNSLFWTGFVLIEPNEACAMVFFGVYKGTIKKNGFFFVNPFYKRKKLSLRARNMNIDPIKVNDKIGNPIMIGLVLVWKIADTYKVLFDIEGESSYIPIASMSHSKKSTSYDNFVRIQSDAALRKVAGLYPYDDFDNEHHELTLRASSDEVNKKLEQELSERLSIAGIEIIEARINYLAYASEIASAMLRRQQATAIIAAREKIVEGAVSMVQLALNKLSEQEIIEFDDDKKAAMVSNLMVVLCADEAVQPVINTGTLHQ
jgi:regulator of protease activity HflC (stomatin/prohibitin superfamily)